MPKRNRDENEEKQKDTFRKECANYTEEDYVNFCRYVKNKLHVYFTPQELNMPNCRETFLWYVQSLPFYELVGYGA